MVRQFQLVQYPLGRHAVSEAVSEKTGVDIAFISPEGSEAETLDALIAGNNLPDLVTLGWWESQLSTIIDRGMVYALNQLADEYDPYFWTAADQERLNWYTQEDGSVYCYPNSSYAPRDYEEDARIGSNQTFLVRRDIYEAIGSPDMTTPEGFAGAVRAAAASPPWTVFRSSLSGPTSSPSGAATLSTSS